MLKGIKDLAYKYINYFRMLFVAVPNFNWQDWSDWTTSRFGNRNFLYSYSIDGINVAVYGRVE